MISTELVGALATIPSRLFSKSLSCWKQETSGCITRGVVRLCNGCTSKTQDLRENSVVTCWVPVHIKISRFWKLATLVHAKNMIKRNKKSQIKLQSDLQTMDRYNTAFTKNLNLCSPFHSNVMLFFLIIFQCS